MEYKDNYYTLSTGTKFYANCGVIGLGMSEGWDGGIDDSNFTKAEREEIADYCIKEWEKYKKSKTPYCGRID